MEPIRIAATKVRPGHSLRLEYGRPMCIQVTAVANEPQWVRLVGALTLVGSVEPFDYADNSRHLHRTMLLVYADRNEPPTGINPAWNDMTRVIRYWDGNVSTVWSLDDPDEPIGHGGRLRGEIQTTAAGWVWRAVYGKATGIVVGDYLDAETALLDATKALDEEVAA